MCRYYIIVEIEYREYDTGKDGKVKVKNDFDAPQDNLEFQLISCIKHFYAEKKNCEIFNIKVIDIASY